MNRHLYYTVQYLIRGKSSNLIKIISLTLGMVVALVLFSKVSYEMSYDAGYPDVNRLYRLERDVKVNGEAAYTGPVIPGAIPAGLKQEIAGIEESLLILASHAETTFLYEENAYKEPLLIADKGFFELFGVRIIEGDQELIKVSNQVFLSRSLAKRIFGEKGAVGQTLLMNRKSPVTVAGVYADIPSNSHIHTDMILSFETVLKEWHYNIDWAYQDSYIGYLKLAPGVSPKDIEEKIPPLIERHTDTSAFGGMDFLASYSLTPVKEIHSGDPVVKKMILILSLLAISLLFVAAMNYVLISISSLVKRAKSIGVHKCNGASSAHIFRQFLQETGILAGISILLSVVVIFVCRQPIENLLQLPLEGLLSFRNIYVIGIVIAAILLTAGIIPGWFFSSIPVTQVFRAYTATNRQWKNILLFVQFGGIAFVVSLLWIIVKQYDMLIHKEMGYTVENIVYTEGIEDATGEQLVLLKQEFEKLPNVAAVSLADHLPVERMSGWPINDETGENMLFSARSMFADRDYLETMGIELKMGTTFPESREKWGVLVNESFVEAMRWTDSPIGKTHRIDGDEMVIVGVLKNFQLMTFHAQSSAMFQDVPPLLINPLYPDQNTGNRKKLIVRLHATDSYQLAELTATMRGLLNNPDAVFVDYQTRITDSYKEARLFRDSILIASFIMVLVALLGLVGYVQDEINRRTKEIGIRKINGATVKDILITLSTDIVYIAIPSIVAGIMASWFVGGQWLQQFAVKIPMTVFFFLTSGLFVLAIILLCVIIRSWDAANENPAYSLKTE